MSAQRKHLLGVVRVCGATGSLWSTGNSHTVTDRNIYISMVTAQGKLTKSPSNWYLSCPTENFWISNTGYKPRKVCQCVCVFLPIIHLYQNNSWNMWRIRIKKSGFFDCAVTSSLFLLCSVKNKLQVSQCLVFLALLWKLLWLLLIYPLLPISHPVIWINGSGPQIVLSSNSSLRFVS